MSSLSVAKIQEDFPILKREVNGKRLVYLDSASSSQTPTSVLDAMNNCYQNTYANVHRGVYTIAEETTSAFEGARLAISRFIGASSPSEVVFTRNATEAVNLVAQTWGRTNLKPGDAIVLTQMEHHANIVPWQMLAAELDLELRWIPITPDYQLDLTNLESLLAGAKLLAFSSMSNVLGTINDVPALVAAAHNAGALARVDACQSVPNLPTNVVTDNSDFMVFSAHKMLGPSGVGALWARAELLEAMPPFLGGGEMIRDVTLEGFTTNEIPWKFEAGTPAIVEVIGWGAAVDYLEKIGLAAVREHEAELTAYALDALADRFGKKLTIYGPLDIEHRGSAVSFLFEDIHAHDISQVVDEEAVCVRAGHHCAKPLMRVLGVPATTRASFYIYNDTRDIDILVDALVRAEKFFGV